MIHKLAVQDLEQHITGLEHILALLLLNEKSIDIVSELVNVESDTNRDYYYWLAQYSLICELADDALGIDSDECAESLLQPVIYIGQLEAALRTFTGFSSPFADYNGDDEMNDAIRAAMELLTAHGIEHDGYLQDEGKG